MYRMRSPSNSLDKNIIKELKFLLNPRNTRKISPKRKFPSIKISEIYNSLYKDNFPLILYQTRNKFLDKIIKEGDEIISKANLNNQNLRSEILESKENIRQKYENDFLFLSIEYNKFLKNKKNYNYFSHFRKHCGKTDKYGYHFCDINKKSKFIEIKKNGEISYVICEGCKICYSTDFILMFCNYCNRKYFSNKLKSNEDENILPATWNKYHCNSLINEIMKCIKCKSILYLNLRTGYLICSNKKCKFISKPEDIVWTCIICGIEFSSSAKIYNPLDFQILNNSIKFALIRQIKAAPKKLPCNCTKDLSKLIFYHKEECGGELLKGTLMDKNIIVCNECHAVNFEERFSWICPICGVKFHLRSVIGTKPFVKKKYVINRNFNRTLGINESKYLSKNLKNLELNNEIKNIIIKDSLSPRIGGNITMNNINTKKIYFNNNLSLINNLDSDRSKENKIYDYNKKEKIANIKEYKSDNSNSSKKKKYRTLLDILRKRQNSESGNQKKEEKENEFNKTMLPSKTKNLKILQIPKKKDNNIKKDTNMIKPSNLRNKYIKIKPYKEYNTSNEIKNSEENKETIKGILDTTDNSTFKTLSMNEPNKNIHVYNSIHNETNNKRSINDYNNRKSKRLMNNIELKNNNLFNLYKHKNNKFKLLKFDKNDTEQICLDDEINLRNTSNNISLNKDNKSIPFFSYINNNSINRNNKINNYSKETSANKKIIKEDNNNMLYSDKTPFYNSSIEKKEKDTDTLKQNKEFKTPSSSIDKSPDSPKGEKIYSFSSSSEEEKQEKKDIIPDIIINSSMKKNRRESLILHGSIMRQSILISQEKLTNLSNNTKIPLINESDYNFIKPIGDGTYGSVYLVEHNETLEKYALKKIVCRDYFELLKQKNEIELVFSVKHEHILNLYGIQFKYLDETTSSINVLMELANSDWNKEIKKRFLAKKYYKENEIINILRQIIKGFLYLQDKNIVHRDIKPQNILLFPNNIYKIADFGEAKFIKNIKEQSTLKGSELFMSPLLYKGYKYNKNNVFHNPFKSDVFSLGYCLLYAMSLNINLLDELRELTTMRSIINCINKFLITNNYSKKLINLVYKMIEPNEDLRYDFEDLANELNKI